MELCPFNTILKAPNSRFAFIPFQALIPLIVCGDQRFTGHTLFYKHSYE